MMNEESFNMNVRKFLKKLGITAQREIERAVLEGIANGQLKGDETLTAKVQITLKGTTLDLEIDGEVALQ
tara:strand:+ start:154 stop:363 length:210 start_codon:yes stop_codon:yes gene_type:complete